MRVGILPISCGETCEELLERLELKTIRPKRRDIANG